MRAEVFVNSTLNKFSKPPATKFKETFKIYSAELLDKLQQLYSLNMPIDCQKLVIYLILEKLYTKLRTQPSEEDLFWENFVEFWSAFTS